MNEMEKYLPHRDPFLYVDRIEETNEERIIGYRLFTDKEYFFKGHFPDYPVVPGVLLVESMAQCGGAGLKKAGTMDSDSLFFIALLCKAQLRIQARPGAAVRF